ncbi:hypothetical protein [Pseudoduganella chitinolytica]|uniref:Uncharacterized protein n=1 Tax=Pseudoduganella chitinolytica TaxID=34070 RepID=A0ABY8BHC7_9BURK|nr:hypothetical protein [Pseudoduganella chitinolytica]WEF33769.1 hypothetical protein PX653_02965 [Pseudoduganella chitinolytica]
MNTPQTRMDAHSVDRLKFFSDFLRKTLKFFATLPLPILDEQEWAYKAVCKAVEKAASVRRFGPGKKNLKFFAGNPKVLLSSVVTCSDVANLPHRTNSLTK